MKHQTENKIHAGMSTPRDKIQTAHTFASRSSRGPAADAATAHGQAVMVTTVTAGARVAR
jgi:hypothetical protein